MLYNSKNTIMHLAKNGILLGTDKGIKFAIYPVRQNDFFQFLYGTDRYSIEYKARLQDICAKMQNYQHRRGHEFDFDKWVDLCSETYLKSQNPGHSIRLMAKNPDVRQHISHKIPTNRKIAKTCSESYIESSRKIYGNTIEMNGKTYHMNDRIAEYLDGNTPIGYRPLQHDYETMGKVKSGRNHSTPAKIAKGCEIDKSRYSYNQKEWYKN